jgi:hypothetical protein
MRRIVIALDRLTIGEVGRQKPPPSVSIGSSIPESDVPPEVVEPTRRIS